MLQYNVIIYYLDL